jgi:hypothetical protein
LVKSSPDFLQRPKVRLIPILAREGKPSVNLEQLRDLLQDVAIIEPLIAIQSPAHWEEVIRNLDDSIDGILPLSNPAYPTEIWNAKPLPLVERGLPVIFWALLKENEPDFWRYAAKDMLETLGAEVYLVNNNIEGQSLIKALAMRRFFGHSKLVVFGEQNFPWNAHAVGDRLTKRLGIEIIVRSIDDIRDRYSIIKDSDIENYQQLRLNERYQAKDVNPVELKTAIRTTLAIQTILMEEKAIGFGVNCFGDLVISGKRDVPCLAQLLLREEGFISACDGDFIAMTGIAIGAYYLNKPSMTSNLYPVRYEGALTSHFGQLLSPGNAYPKERWENMARFAHCGYIGIVPPEMTPNGSVRLSDWGGTYEIKRDGRGCGVDGELASSEPITVFSMTFNAEKLIATKGVVAETTRHSGMPHCESSALLEIENLLGFAEEVSRDHVIVVYGDHMQDLRIFSQIMNLDFITF